MDVGDALLFAEIATLALVAMLTALLFYVTRLAFMKGENPGGGRCDPSQETETPAGKRLLIPALVLRRTHAYLMEHGKARREWEVALGCQGIGGDLAVTDAHSLKCTDSTSVSAESDYVDLARAQDLFERFGGRIVSIAHLHPWPAPGVTPSGIDWNTQKWWEKLYKGEFVGIVFTNNGIFRIFYTEGCTLRPEVVGKGVKKVGEDLYALEN